MAACEKPVVAEKGEETIVESQPGKLTVQVAQLEGIPFAKLAGTGVENGCTMLNFAFYDQSGTRVKQVNQKAGDNGFGLVTLQLDEGDYQLLVLAHSCSKNPTMTNAEKIQFNNSTGYTDTYLYYGPLTVTAETQRLELNLHRIVAGCRFVMVDTIPDGVASLRFTYKGGSGHFNAATGLGVTNSTQQVSRSVMPGETMTTCDLFTFLHEVEDDIQLTVTALDAEGNEVMGWEYDVAMKRNRRTWMTGSFFRGVPSTKEWTLNRLEIDTNWGEEVFYSY